MKTNAFLLSALILFIIASGCEKEELASPEIISGEVETRGADSTLTAIMSFRAWVWADQPTTPAYTPHTSYQYNSLPGAAPATITRASKGNYLVRISRAGGFSPGVGHVTAYGGSHSAQIGYWTRSSGNDLLISVKVFAPNGQPEDGRFVLFFYKEEARGASYNSAYQWGTSRDLYSFNSKGGTNTVIRGASPGLYTVTFEGITPNLDDRGQGGTIIATPYGSQAIKVQVKSWSFEGNKLTAIIQVRNAQGLPSDGLFVVSYISDFRVGQPYRGESASYGAYVRSDFSGVRSYIPDLTYQKTNTSAAPVSVERVATGYYKVSLPLIRSYDSTMALATAYGATKNHVSIDHWERNARGGTDVYVRGISPEGIPADTRFTLFYYTNENILF